jgi:hypothetical protein
MWRIDRALDLTAFAKSQTLDGIGREKHVGRFRREIPLRGTQESESLFGHLQPTFHDDRLALGLGMIAALVSALVSTTVFAPVFTLSAALIIAPLLIVAAVAAATAAALIVALPLMPPMSLMVTAMTTPTNAATLTEAALATARTEGALMPLLPLRPALLGISLKTGGLSSGGACVTRIGSVDRLR